MLHIRSVVCYGFLSFSMVFINKFLLDKWKFDYPIFLILTQMLMNICVVLATKMREKKFTEIIDSIKKNIKYEILVAIFYSLHAVTALKALKNMNIPMYTIFKRCTPIVNLMLSLYLHKHPVDGTLENVKNNKIQTQINISIVAMTVGVLIAGYGDLGFSLSGYLFCGFSVICQALYLTSIQLCGIKEKDSLQALLKSSIFSLPFLIPTFIVSVEFNDLFIDAVYPHFNNGSFWMAFFAVIISGCLLNFTLFWCTMNNNALTTSVVGVFKSIIQTICGFFLFNTLQQTTTLTILGVFLNLISGTCYTALKFKEKEETVKINLV
jgi:solute carrier family 35